MQALEKAFQQNALLRSCDDEQRSAIFDAMFERNVERELYFISPNQRASFMCQWNSANHSSENIFSNEKIRLR